MPPSRSNLATYASSAHLGRLQLHGPHPRVDRPSVAPPPAGRRTPVRSTSALPVPETPSLVLMITWLIEGRTVSISPIASVTSSRLCRSSAPERMRDVALGEQPAASGLGAEVGESRIRAVHRNAESSARGRVRARWCCTGCRWQRERLGICAAIRSSSRGRSSSFCGQRTVGGVVGGDQGQPGHRVARDHPGEQSEVVLDDARVDRHRGHVDHPQRAAAAAAGAGRGTAPRTPG